MHKLLDDKYRQAVEQAKLAGKSAAELDPSAGETIFNATYQGFVQNFNVNDIFDEIANDIANEIAKEFYTA